jgi:hypothetical protein
MLMGFVFYYPFIIKMLKNMLNFDNQHNNI